MTTPTAVKPETRVLTLADTCDRCGYTEDTDSCGFTHHGAISSAYVLVTFPSGHELQFCGHHYSVHELALVAAGATVAVDNRESLTIKPGFSA